MAKQPDNSQIRALMERAAEEKRTRGGGGRLGDYVQDLPYRVLAARGGAGQEGEGPLASPVVAAEEGELSVAQAMQELLFELRRLPQQMSLEMRTKFPMQPRESISFISPTISVNVPGGTAVAVVQQALPQSYGGFLTHVGVNVTPAGSFPNIVWQIRVNGAIHPEFANRIFMANTLATPLPFLLELTQSRTVQLVAINTGGVAITVQGVLVGWTEFLSTYKSYGASPSAGV